MNRSAQDHHFSLFPVVCSQLPVTRTVFYFPWRFELSGFDCSRKLADALSVKEQKPSLINQHSVVYKFSCPLCDAEYVGLTTRHLFQRIEEHCRSSSSICRHLQQDHDTSPRSLGLAKNFAVLKQCQGKMDCLVYEMLLIKKYRPSLLNTC